jgi:hypothetical protein
MKKWWNTLASFAEYIMIALMLVAAATLLMHLGEPVAAGRALGPTQQLLGLDGSKLFYAGLYIAECLVWLCAVLFRWVRVRKWTLFAIYMTHQFTFFLVLGLNGPDTSILDNAAIAVISGALWLRYKLASYISYEELAHYEPKS